MSEKFKNIIESCKICGGKGHIFNLTTKIEDGKPKIHSISKECECIKKYKLYKKLEGTNIPFEYYDLDFMKDFVAIDSPENINIKRYMERILNNIDGFISSGMSLYIYGSQGNGKSLAATSILKKAVMNGKKVHYDWFSSIVDEFSKKGYVADEKKEKYLELVKSTDVFVLDELGKETEMNNMTKNDVCKLFEINILKRRSNKTTIILSNLPNGLAEIRNRYNPSIHSFMFQKYRELEFKGQDFRIGFGGVNNFFEGL